MLNQKWLYMHFKENENYQVYGVFISTSENTNMEVDIRSTKEINFFVL